MPPKYSAMVVPSAAPLIPIVGKPRFPKIKTQSKKMFKDERKTLQIAKCFVWFDVWKITVQLQPIPSTKKIGEE